MKAAELRQSILQAAVQGKLVPQDPHDEPASELLQRIQQEKAQLVKEGKLKKEKPMPPITADEIPYDLPEGWIWCRLGELIYYSDAGKSPACKNSPANKNETGVIKTTAVQYKRFLPHENKVLPANFQFDSRMLIHTGDILITRAGPKNRTGIACLVDKCDGALILSDKTVRLNCGGEFVYKPYIVAAINSLPIRNLLIEKMTGMAESQVNISQSNIAIILFPVPPLIEQQRIMTKINELMVLCDALEAEEKKLDVLEAHLTEYLPKAILQAAVQGKLVLQDSHDEPASELLKRIQQEKVQLVKEGKLKKEKPLPPILEDEIPYDLPEGWEWCRFGEIALLISGRDLEPSSYNNHQRGIPYITGASNLIDDNLDINRWTEKPIVVSQRGDILLSCKGTIGKTVFNNIGDCHIARQIMAIRPVFAYILPQYISIMLEASIEYFIEQARSIIPGISRKDILNLVVAIPPLAEQQHIVSKVDELMDLCNRLKAAYTIPIPLSKSNNIIPFPTAKTEEETLLAARGDVGQLSNEAMRAIDDLFAEDEE